ncbi:hypothetical protein C5167_005496 [Papaver somniferum]|uniref:Plectin/eS10 N-terminal domain-containing protein n=1 Tax=Papaver somniferum TaxID=3469 RepID=A0A4Y7JDW6_PAPSO|nr:hypothetical protein C5167_005496 [Papaver somniferum]
MVMSETNFREISKYLCEEGLMSKEYVPQHFAWGHYYHYLTPDGLEFLRTHLNPPSVEDSRAPKDDLPGVFGVFRGFGLIMEPHRSGAGKQLSAEDSAFMRRARLFGVESVETSNDGSVFQDGFILRLSTSGYHTIDESPMLLVPEVVPLKVIPLDNLPRLCIERGDYREPSI